MDINNRVVQLCIAGTQAEYAHQPEEARALYWQAWQLAADDFEACVAAHYVARFQETPEDILQWNLTALSHADAAKDDRVRTFYPSLYLNLGRAYEQLGRAQEARRYYDLAASLGFTHHPD